MYTVGQVKLSPPYVLVGHSLGGQYVELFARLHPDEVVGVVLVDSRHPEFTQRAVLCVLLLWLRPQAALCVSP